MQAEGGGFRVQGLVRGVERGQQQASLLAVFVVMQGHLLSTLVAGYNPSGVGRRCPAPEHKRACPMLRPQVECPSGPLPWPLTPVNPCPSPPPCAAAQAVRRYLSAMLHALSPVLGFPFVLCPSLSSLPTPALPPCHHDVQLRDGTFRRHFLVQVSALLHFMVYPTVKDKNAAAALSSKAEGLDELNNRVRGCL